MSPRKPGPDDKTEQVRALAEARGYKMSRPWGQWRLRKDGKSRTYTSLKKVLLAIMAGKRAPSRKSPRKADGNHAQA